LDVEVGSGLNVIITNSAHQLKTEAVILVEALKTEASWMIAINANE
jgi:hypothetical protein